MYEVAGVTLGHGGPPVVSGLDLTFESGAVTALCGPNGAGKSTLLAALAGDLAPRTGVIRLAGHPVAGHSPAALARMRAVLEQSPGLAADFDVTTLAGLSVPREVPPAAAARLVRQVLVDLNLSALATASVLTLSGGQRHRAHLARAIAQLRAGRSLGGGKALLLDEPTASLDITHQVTVMEAARQAAAEGAAVIVVLHDLNLAAAFADRIVILHQGGVAADGPAATALRSETLSRVYQSAIDVTHHTGRTLVVPVYASQPTLQEARQ
ncbi:ATP-binding cassette domain-containing protein [Algicella marina]|uniref:ATP-binding cassette domain-containing protein n=1 Tax=Algicella marina TaxID=2683284 RepID=A0A6P1T2U1_9RHOB|nr:ATP-binding cassette domain-containing protein [Algicella marina]QHQ37038.1 ATP-binding cassette domain-containing protein [Algicella marina]